MKLMRLQASSGWFTSLFRIWRDRPDIVVSRLDNGNALFPPGGVKIVSLLEPIGKAHSPLHGLLIWVQSHTSYLFVAQDRSTGVACALRWRLPLDRIRLLEDDDRAIVDAVVSEVRYRGRGRAWHRT